MLWIFRIWENVGTNSIPMKYFLVILIFFQSVVKPKLILVLPKVQYENGNGSQQNNDEEIDAGGHTDEGGDGNGGGGSGGNSSGADGSPDDGDWS